MNTLLVFCTLPSVEQAREIARLVVSEKLAACVNVLPAVASVYEWEGKMEEIEEVLMLLKTRRERYSALELRLRGLHPYEVPEIVAVDVAAGLPAYLQWVAGQTVC